MSTELTLRRMRPEDLQAGLQLTQAENWSHRLADWALHFRLGQGWVACDLRGEVLGTTLWWAYGERFGTVGLVVVNRAHQGKGIGRLLMNTVLQDAGARTLQLVATRAGLKLYRQCGFAEFNLIGQHQGLVRPQSAASVSAGTHLPPLPAAPLPAGTQLRPLSATDRQRIVELDTAAIGAPRTALIAAVLDVGRGVVAEREGRVTGFALARDFGRGTSIGPVVAADETLATALIAHHLRDASGFARVDIPADAVQLASWLEAAGLACVDRVTVMVRGEPPEPTGDARVFGLVSQALG